ncbi:MAG: hypothetical protein ABEJ28_08740 [Salinigranum sp.]
MRPRKIALLLIVLGALCLPAPAYLGWAARATAPTPQTSQVYSAEPLDLSTATDRATVVSRYGYRIALSTHRVSHRYSAGVYRAPNETRRTLEAAMENGTATTADAGARADLRSIAANYSFVYDAYAHREQYYRLRVSDDGSEVRTRPVSRDRVANATVDRVAVRYADLSPGERRTVDRILGNASGDGSGYRPRVDDPFVDRLPALVYRDGTLYSLYAYGHVDDFGPGFFGFLAGLAVAGVGVVLLLVGSATLAVLWWRERGSEANG